VAQEREAQAAIALSAIENAEIHQRQLAQRQALTAGERVAAATERLELAADVATLTHQSFELGVATSTDVLAADFALADARADADIATMAETLAHWRTRWAGLDAAMR
jgi:outer membrane protein TolC